ncbi:reverse transcriptase [Pseudomonas sp. ODNR1LW]|nr:reverse transcriptase [Pseudomonas sp. ODNR1LW]
MHTGTKRERLERLVSHGYFAPELPLCFNSFDLAKHSKSILSVIDKMPHTKKNNPSYYTYVSEPTWFYYPRFSKDDRRHGIPNPINHLLLSRILANHYVALRKIARKSKLSRSPPVFDWVGPRALARANADIRDDFRVELAARREMYVAADVRAFFHSIYTHAIAWAVHGKGFAKRHRGLNHFGNVIDLLCRNAQDGQTIGLPVGPDTSRLIAEVVASAIDVQLQKQLKIRTRDASRYIDDYTLSSARGLSGEEILAQLRVSVSAFELELNNDKSAVVPTTQRQMTGWQPAIRARIPRPERRGDQVPTTALLQLFYELGRLCDDHPDTNVEKFGLQNARLSLVAASDWLPVQTNLISAYRRNPSLVSLLVELCLLRQAAHGDVGKDDLCEFIENRIDVLARGNRTGELVWLLFLAARLGITISSRRLGSLFVMENALVALLVTYLNAQGLINGNIDRSTWDQSLNSAGLKSQMWLYAYEAVTQGFIKDVSDEFIKDDAYFSLLREKKVQFLNIELGYASVADTLRNLRHANTRLSKLRDAIEDGTDDELDDVFDEDDDDDDIYGDDDSY